VEGVISLGDEYKPPDFCDDCGSPLPWVSRQGRIFELMNLLDEEELDSAAQLEVREQLEALTSPDLDDAEITRRWKRIKTRAPGLWEQSGARSIMESLVSAAIKSQIGL
jgi:hypothetical protein